MILFIDETENTEFFIVAGILADSPEVIETAYRKFKKKIKGFNISPKNKSRIYTEFKSTILDNDFQRIKKRMLEEIHDMDGIIIYSCYMKKGIRFNQILKESVYITLLSSIVSSIDSECDIVFDAFGKTDFESQIIKSIEPADNVKSIISANSEKEHGLQFADNICSVIRLHKSTDEKDYYYELIRDIVKEV